MFCGPAVALSGPPSLFTCCSYLQVKCDRNMPYAATWVSRGPLSRGYRMIWIGFSGDSSTEFIGRFLQNNSKYQIFLGGDRVFSLTSCSEFLNIQMTKKARQKRNSEFGCYWDKNRHKIVEDSRIAFFYVFPLPSIYTNKTDDGKKLEHRNHSVWNGHVPNFQFKSLLQCTVSTD